MPDQKHKPIRSAMRDEQRRLSEQAYPGDLAHEALEQHSAPSRLRLLRYPALATALIGIGMTLAIALLPRHDDNPATPGPTISVLPAPETPTKQPAIAQAPANPTPAPPVEVATTPLPEIDRDLLPVSRNSKVTWLTSPKPHLAQIEKHTRLAANPNPDKRLRVTFSLPTRRSIDRSLSRTLSIKPTRKPGRTS